MEQTYKDELFIRWMNEAFRMETSIIPILERHIGDAEGHPKLQARLQQHLDATHHHADLVRSCLERLGQPPAPDDGTANPLDNVHTAVDGDRGDLLIKDGLNDFSTENSEIATYFALVTAARDLGQTDCERSFQEILRDEQEMAGWLNENLPLLVEQTIRHAA